MSSPTSNAALRNLRILTPCQADWNEMTGDDREKFCAQCQKNVHDVSAMTRAEASALLAAGNPICVRFYRDADGNVATTDSTPAPGLLGRRNFLTVIAAGAAAVMVPIFGLAQGDAAIAGTVVNPAKAKVFGVRIQLKQVEQIIAETKTDALGNFRFAEAKAGSYQLTASHPGFMLETLHVTVSDNAPKRLTIELKAAQRTMGIVAMPPKGQ